MPKCQTRTSQSHPLRIDTVRVEEVRGLIGLTFCPGKKQEDALSGSWERDLAVDLNAVEDWGATTWVNLLTREEMACLGVENLRNTIESSNVGIRYFHLPIKDTGIPDMAFEDHWAHAGKAIRDDLLNEGRVLIHCKGGLGRSGTIAARLLVELGVEPEIAIRRVRETRPGSIENASQESHVRSVRCLRRSSQAIETRGLNDREIAKKVIAERDLLQVQELFHGLIRSRAREGKIPVPRSLPKLAMTARSVSEEGEWFAVPGMFGGFTYRLEVEGELRLITSSWCRVAEGSGRQHVITTKEIRLLEEGFV